jgi:hypothetical protein
MAESLRCKPEVAGSIPNVVEIFYWQEKRVPGIFPGVVWQPYHIHMPIVMKSGSLNLLEPSEPVQDSNGIVLPCTDHTKSASFWNN